MRHDFHFVEELAAASRPAEPVETIGRMVELERLRPNPGQPRKDLGDLADLISSVKEKGLLEPILVRAHGDAFQIIAGERRYHAARAAGLTQVPCIEMEVDDRGVMEISLIENLQRRDLTPFEEGDAILSLCEQFDYTHEKVAQKLAKSRTSITELLNIARIPEEIREACRRADISSKSLLIEIARQDTHEEMARFVELVASNRLSRDDARRIRSLAAEPELVPAASDAVGPAAAAVPAPPAKPSTFRFQSTDRRVSVSLRFDRTDIGKAEILAALTDLIRQIESSGDLPA